jgi:hypothetical protein
VEKASRNYDKSVTKKGDCWQLGNTPDIKFVWLREPKLVPEEFIQVFGDVYGPRLTIGGTKAEHDRAFDMSVSDRQ